MHLYFSDIQINEESLMSAVGSQTWQVFAHAASKRIERSVDDLAMVFGGLIDDSKFAKYLPERY